MKRRNIVEEWSIQNPLVLCEFEVFLFPLILCVQKRSKEIPEGKETVLCARMFSTPFCCALVPLAGSICKLVREESGGKVFELGLWHEKIMKDHLTLILVSHV